MFSPDSKLVAFSAPDDFKYMHNERIYVRHVDQPTEQWKKLGANFDGDVRAGGRGNGDGVESSSGPLRETRSTSAPAFARPRSSSRCPLRAAKRSSSRM